MMGKNLINQAIVKSRSICRFTKGGAVKKLLVALLFLPLVALSDDNLRQPGPAATQSKPTASVSQSSKHYTNSVGQVIQSPTKLPSAANPTVQWPSAAMVALVSASTTVARARIMAGGLPGCSSEV